MPTSSIFALNVDRYVEDRNASFDYEQLFFHICTIASFYFYSRVLTEKLYYLLPHYDQKLPKIFQKIMVIIFQVHTIFVLPDIECYSK